MKTIKKIHQELDRLIPDIKTEVKEKVDWQQIKLNNAPKKRSFNLKLALSSACCLLVLGLSIALPLSIKNKDQTTLNTPINTVSYKVILDINPRVEFTIDNNNIVTKQKALNKDGVVLLYKNNVVGQTLQDATKNIITDIKEDGLINQTIKLSVKDNKGKQNLDKENFLKDIINSNFASDSFNVIYLNEDELEDFEEYYENHKVSEYEKTFISEFQDKLRLVVNEKINKITSITDELNEFLIGKDVDSEEIINDLNVKIKADIKAFELKYGYDTKIIWTGITYKAINECCKDLTEHKLDLQESLEEIKEEDDDYGELLEELFEIVKDELFKEND